jgi:hypothetical protein
MKDFISFVRYSFFRKLNLAKIIVLQVLSGVNPLDKTYQGLLQELFHGIKMFLDIFAQKLTESPF